MASKAVEKRPRVDPRDEPSAEWGWHGTFPKATRAAGWFTAAAMLIMLIGNHRNAMEDIWLVGIAATLVLLLVLDIRKRRTAWRK
ncbi:DUF2631 domain-containing protein [Amycolatopsis suaedae]|uniref:DUF2631 domain-containing protein n=1 Tax=Amycolatopsis suaedae TaxID=2510978 RepID=A0A4Q7JC09_9PSEU|nr:DUF2631 domain-containing protein [Amycolatopsis suaedae]RZQ64829.1 DUF2631 domain-containing protein [Amycolatopsis suaedae]